MAGSGRAWCAGAHAVQGAAQRCPALAGSSLPVDRKSLAPPPAAPQTQVNITVNDTPINLGSLIHYISYAAFNQSVVEERLGNAITSVCPGGRSAAQYLCGSTLCSSTRAALPVRGRLSVPCHAWSGSFSRKGRRLLTLASACTPFPADFCINLSYLKKILDLDNMSVSVPSSDLFINVCGTETPCRDSPFFSRHGAA